MTDDASFKSCAALIHNCMPVPHCTTTGRCRACIGLMRAARSVRPSIVDRRSNLSSPCGRTPRRRRVLLWEHNNTRLACAKPKARPSTAQLIHVRIFITQRQGTERGRVHALLRASRAWSEADVGHSKKQAASSDRAHRRHPSRVR